MLGRQNRPDSFKHESELQRLRKALQRGTPLASDSAYRKLIAMAEDGDIEAAQILEESGELTYVS